jgi:hypothetical protein
MVIPWTRVKSGALWRFAMITYLVRSFLFVFGSLSVAK